MDGALLLKLSIRSLIVVAFAGAFGCQYKYLGTGSAVGKLGAYMFCVIAAITAIATCVDIGCFIVS